MIRRLLHFGDCSLDIAARELRRAGVRIDLPPSVFDCIAYLAEHRARAVGRDELVSAVWGKTAISDTMLGKAILGARRALGDSAEAQAILRTVPRYGYHWVADTRVEEFDAASAAIDPIQAPAIINSPSAILDAQPRGRVRVPIGQYVLIAVGLIVVIAGTSFLAITHDEKTLPAAVEPAQTSAATGAMIAVLPAEILAGSADAWMRLGLMDLLATRLRDAGLAVVASDSVVRLIPADAVGEEAIVAARHALDARLLMPAVRRSGDAWIVRVELIDGDRRRQIVQVQANNAIAATAEASDRVLGALGQRVVAANTSTADLSVAELLQRADAARLAEDIDLARSLITSASPAMQALPEVRMRGIRIDLRAGAFEQARIASEALLAEVAVEQDPVLHARVLENLCVAHLRLGQMEAALAACNASIGLLETRDEPLALGRAYSQRGIIHARQRQRDAALADFARARIALTVAGDPLLLAQLDGNESTVEMVSGRPAEALPTLERAGRTFERFGMLNEAVVALVNRIDANLMLLQPLAALKASDEGWAQRGRISDPQVRHAFEQRRADALAANGRLGEARVVLDELIHAAHPAPEPGELALARSAQARLDMATAQPTTAVLLAAQAVAELTSPEDAAPRARIWMIEVRALHDLDRGADAGREADALRAWSSGVGSAQVALYATLAEAEHAAFTRRRAQAIDAYERAMAIASQRTIADTFVEVAISYASFLLVDGDLEQAAATVGKIARHAERDFDTALIEARLYHALGREPAWQDALARARRLAGERRIPERIATLPDTKAPFAQK